MEVSIMKASIVLATAALAFAATLMAGTADAKGPFRIQISGEELVSPITIEGPVPVETVFLKDAVESAPPRELTPAYTLKLMPEQPDGDTGQYPVLMTLTYFPGSGDGPAILAGDWDSDRYFEASAEFQAMLDGAIRAAAQENGHGVAELWYIAPALAAAGLVLLGGLAGRKSLFRG
jgi:hypothetical protein